MRKKSILAANIAISAFMSITPISSAGADTPNDKFIPFTINQIDPSINGLYKSDINKDEKTTPEGEVELIDGEELVSTIKAPKIEAANNAVEVSARTYMGNESKTELSEDVDWDSLMNRINGQLDDINAQIEASKEQQIAADMLFRQNNPELLNANTDVSIKDGVLYPPETPGGSPVEAALNSIKLPPNATQIEKLIASAKTQLGVPYLWGGTSPGVGLDCSGLTQWAYSQIGVSLPRTTYDQINVGTPIYNQSDLMPGDLVFPHEGHVGIAISNTEFIHAPQTGDVVKIAPIYQFMKGVRIL